MLLPNATAPGNHRPAAPAGFQVKATGVIL